MQTAQVGQVWEIEVIGQMVRMTITAIYKGKIITFDNGLVKCHISALEDSKLIKNV